MRKRPLEIVLPGAIALALGLLGSVQPSQADWLVTRDGGKVETRGPWQVKGKLVAFTRANGQLATMRLADVDLDASAKATAMASAPAVAPAAPADAAHRKSVLVLTDRDVGHVDGAGEPVGDVAKDEKAPADADGAAGAVIVQNWQKALADDGSGLDIFGSLKNKGKDTATNIAVTVKLLDSEGKIIGTAEGTVSAAALAPDGTTTFRASFLGIREFASARFEVKNRALLTAPTSSPST
ncbi:MAG: FxLYD domain-containing protein [Pseudolysinimonas sp.]